MQVITSDFVKNKKVLLRYDIDVALRFAQGKPTEGGEMEVAEDFKLKAGIPTLKLCLENASKVIIIGHLGRPFETVEDEKKGNPLKLSVKPIQAWFEQTLRTGVVFAENLEQATEATSKIVLLENTRFFHGEVEGDIDFVRQLASLGEVYVNEAFSSYNKGASTTMLPVLLPHAAGLHFAKEVRKLADVRDNPKKPFVAIMGGAKVKDKLPVILSLAKNADAVLVGGKLAKEISNKGLLSQNKYQISNIITADLNNEGTDITDKTVESWRSWISQAAMIVWNGPLGKFEDLPAGRQGPKNDATKKIARMILDSGAEIVIGGGDTVAALNQYGLLQEAEKKAFVSVGGGAMLKFLSEGTLPTIDALT